MKRFKDYNIDLVNYATFNKLLYKGKSLADINKNGIVRYIYISNVISDKEGMELVKLVRKGKIKW